MSKLKFILLIFILISIISVALAETHQSTTAEEGAESEGGGISHMEQITIVSLLFVVISLFINHFMEDHDNNGSRLLKLQRYCEYIKNDKSINNLTAYSKFNDEISTDCLLFRVTQRHFGPISFTLISCFLCATSLLTWLSIEFFKMKEAFKLCDISILFAIFILFFILFFQLWSFTRQGNMIARWINNLEKIEFVKYCEDNLKKMDICILIPTHRLGEFLTRLRLWLARVNKKSYLNLYTDILIGIWFIILTLIFCICCRCEILRL